MRGLGGLRPRRFLGGDGVQPRLFGGGFVGVGLRLGRSGGGGGLVALGLEDFLGAVAVEDRVIFGADGVGRDDDRRAPAASAGRPASDGGLIKVRSTGDGAPSGWSSDTSASPTFSSVIACATSIAGLGRKVSAADFTAASSRGVKARSACWTRLPSWPATLSGMSIGFWVMK